MNPELTQEIEQSTQRTLQKKGGLSKRQSQDLGYAMSQPRTSPISSGSLPAISSSSQGFSPSEPIPSDNQDEPANVKNAEGYLNAGDNYSGLCEKFTEDMSGSGHLGATAYEAFNNQLQEGRAVQGMDGIKPGDPIYFDADSSNNGDGHSGIYMGNGQFISATNNGVMIYDVNKWTQSTGQQPIGYAPQ